MNRTKALLGVLLAVWIATPFAASASAEEDPKLTDLVNILREQGVISDEQYVDMTTKAAKKEDKKAWTDRIKIWGDFRARYEGFMYDRDSFSRAAENPPPTATDPNPTGTRLEDRHRARYRARLDISAEVASRATVYLRLASGSGESTSVNQTLGRGNDFDNDPFNIDLAYATLSPFPNGELPGIEGGYLAVDIGKVKNPFIWKKGLAEDKLLWDGDISPEGGSLRIKGAAGPVELFTNAGIYIVDENGNSRTLDGTSTERDPKLYAGQIGGSVGIGEAVEVGARGSYYHFADLDSAFFTRGGALGNIVDGLGSRTQVSVIEGSAFVNLDFFDLLPVQVFGSISHNLSARNSRVTPGVGPGNDAYVAGVWIGDKKKLVRLGFSYYYIEANAFPAMFIDSDVTDGVTNRHAYAFYAVRQLFENVDLAFDAYLSNKIRGGIAYAASHAAADRLRMRVDLKFKF